MLSSLIYSQQKWLKIFSQNTWSEETARCWWEGNTEMDLKEVGCKSVDWIQWT
jgi:hypothetical protein